MGAIAGGLIGQGAGAGYQNRANSRQVQAANLFGDIDIPSIDKQQLALLLPEYFGDYQAQQEGAIGMDPSHMQDIAVDPRLVDAQMSALDQLTQIGETGLLPGERAALNQARRGAASEAQAKSAQIMDQFARRGMGGSGNELAAQLQAAQSSGDRLSQESDRTMQMAQQRALNAIGQQGNLAAQIRGQSFGEQSDVAKAQDAINQFNTANKQSVQQRNVAGQNTANLRNLQEQQRLGEAATQTKNAQQVNNKGLIQQQFQNQLARANPYAAQLSNMANSNMQHGQNIANSYAQMGQSADQTFASIMGGGGGGGGAGGLMMMSDENAKKNIKKFDAKAFLDAICPVEYEYIDSRNGEGKKAGVMAQDLEKVLPEAVMQDENGMKHIDYAQMAGPMAASLADLNERLSKMESGKKEEA